MTGKPEHEPKADPKPKEQAETVLLRDLVPRANVTGGSRKLRFGESATLEPRDSS